MIAWLKSLFGSAPTPAPKPFDINTATLAEIDEANIALGRKVDEIREQRKALVARAAQLREGGV